MNIDYKIKLAITRIILRNPIFAVPALYLQFSEDSNIPSISAQGNTVFYNEKFIESLSVENIEFVISHIVLSNAIDDSELYEDELKYRVAKEYFINSSLSYHRIGLIPNDNTCTVDARYYNTSIETIYNTLSSKTHDELLNVPLLLYKENKESGIIFKKFLKVYNEGYATPQEYKCIITQENLIELIDTNQSFDTSSILNGEINELDINNIDNISLIYALCNELKILHDTHTDEDALIPYAINFFNFLLNNIPVTLCIFGTKILVTSFKLPIDPDKLENFDDFHILVGDYISNSLHLNKN